MAEQPLTEDPLGVTLQRVLEAHLDLQRRYHEQAVELGYLRAYLHAHRRRGPLKRVWDWLWVLGPVDDAARFG